VSELVDEDARDMGGVGCWRERFGAWPVSRMRSSSAVLSTTRGSKVRLLVACMLVSRVPHGEVWRNSPLWTLSLRACSDGRRLP